MKRARLRIVGVPCSACIIPVRRALEKATGVKSVGANYVADFILVDYDEKMIDLSVILGLIKKTGYEAVPMGASYF